MTRIILLVLVAALPFCTFAQAAKTTQTAAGKKNPVYSNTDSRPVTRSNDEWQKLLPEEVYQVARQKGTERPWSSPYEALKERGTYYCAVCGNALFVSDAKFESGCGWPSFYQPVTKKALFTNPIPRTA